MEKTVMAGLDVGSVYAKLAAKLPHSSAGRSLKVSGRQGDIVFYEPVAVKGRPREAAVRLLRGLLDDAGDAPILLQLTGSQAALIAAQLSVPWVNEFKATARGCVELVPDARTILEIGGDGTRFMQIDWEPAHAELTIIDCNRNGDCAAGTGSFIDQQAARMKYRVDNIGPLVRAADGCANIAGRCSVFAKSDMVHAQQRGYTPGAIFKGLCEAVVRNFKGTVVRDRQLLPRVVLAGGVAANGGVVDAVRRIFQLGEDEPVVPEFFHHVGALGCLLLNGGALLDRRLLDAAVPASADGDSSRPPLSAERVRFENRRPSASVPSDRFRAFLGIDVGSVSTNLVLIDERGEVIDEVYTRTEGKPIQVVQRELAAWGVKWGGRVEVLGVVRAERLERATRRADPVHHDPSPSPAPSSSKKCSASASRSPTAPACAARPSAEAISITAAPSAYRPSSV